MGTFASSDWTRRWTCSVRTAQARRGAKECDRATGTSVPGNSARSRTGWCRVKNYEGSMKTAARTNSSKTAGSNRHKTRAGEARKPRSIQQKSVYRKRGAPRMSHSIQQKDGPAVRLTGALGRRPRGRIQVHAWMATVQQCKRKTQPM